MTGYSAIQNAKPPAIKTVYRNMVAITPTDATAIGPYEALYVGVAGDVELVPLGQTTPVLFKALGVGWWPFEFQGINATGTTATNLVGLG